VDDFSAIIYAELVRDVQDARGNTSLMARAVQRLRAYYCRMTEATHA
jgi:hypothetical protein